MVAVILLYAMVYSSSFNNRNTWALTCRPSTRCGACAWSSRPAGDAREKFALGSGILQDHHRAAKVGGEGRAVREPNMV